MNWAVSWAVFGRMSPEHASLWQRIEAFAFDEPGAEAPFSARLAREQGWNEAYTRRVMLEYKRFAFLAVAAGHLVTPSKAVDEAWHLHLIYTRNYWEKFCGQALGRPLHHEPSRGGTEDEAKFAGCYARTRESYARFFGTEPPADIWPAPGGGVAPAREKWNWRKWLPFAVVSVGVAGCSGAAMGPLGPFDLRGPDFLVFYFWFATGTFAVAFALRWGLRGPGTSLMRRESLTEASPYAVAALGGMKHVLGAALTSLSARYLLRPERRNQVIRAVGTLPEDAPEIEQRIHELARPSTGANLAYLQAVTAIAMADDVARLRQAGLLLDETAAARVRLVPFMVALLAPAVGAVKIAIGLSRGRPVEFLMILCLVTGALAFLFLRRSWRTRAGDEVWAELRSAHAAGKQRLPNGALPGTESVMLVALFGASVWPAAVTTLHNAMKPESSSSGSDFGGCSGSSCGGGGSSCGGGSGCGGCSGGD